MTYGGIGEVVNTLDCGSNMRGFDSHIPSHIKITHILYVCEFLFFFNTFTFFLLILQKCSNK